MKITLDEGAREGAIRVDLAWELFLEPKSTIPQGHGARLIPFTNSLWDELGKKAGYLNRNLGKELTLAIPALSEEALDFLLRGASFWAAEVDEYYLILKGSGTLRYNDKDVVVKRGDLIAKPTGPDATSQLIADRGEPLRILDMEIWHDRPYSSKDLILNPDFNEIIMRGPGWGGLFPNEALMSSEDFRKHYDEGYRRMKDGGWIPSKARGHKKIREKT